jgi:hypothetical protein
MKKELINLGSRSIVWALYLFFIFWTGGIEFDSMFEFYIIAGHMICIPLVVIIFLRWRQTVKKHTKIFVNFRDFFRFVLPFLLGFIICVCYWASIVIVYTFSPHVVAPVSTTQTLVDQKPKVKSLGEQVSDVYSIYTLANSEKKEASCLDLYLDSINSKNNFDITTACPAIAEGLDFSKIKYSPAGMDEFLSLKEFIDNPQPIVLYLLDNKGDSSIQYQLLYYKYILAQYLKEDFIASSYGYYQEEILGQGGDYYFSSPFPVYTISVAPNIDLALVEDLPSSGAYNIYSSLYKITFTDNNISVELFDKIINTSSTGVSLVKYPNVLQNTEESDFGVNSWLGPKDWTFNYYGMIPFGMYPCQIGYKYEFYNDRLILVSETQAKDCKKYPNMESPDDPRITDDFDFTPVEIYKVTPNILEKAKNL